MQAAKALDLLGQEEKAYHRAAKGLKIMDMTAFALSQENDLPIVVFDMNTQGNLEKVVAGESIGTKVIKSF